jgi:hypothetical protein
MSNVQDFAQSYGQKLYFRLIKSSTIDFDRLALGSLGAGKFMDITTLLPNTAVVGKTGTGSTLKIIAGGTKTITKAKILSNVATLTFEAAHGFANGATIVVAGLPAPFAALNGTRVITGVTTTTPFTLTFAFTGDNETEATVAAGTASGAVLALDGTDPPVQMKGLMNITPTEGETEETIQTYDDETQSFDTSLPTGKTHSIALEGVMNYNDAAYKLMRIASKESVREKLMIEYVITAPNGYQEDTFGFGRFTGYAPNAPAGTIVKFSQNIRTYGPYELEF